MAPDWWREWEASHDKPSGPHLHRPCRELIGLAQRWPPQHQDLAPQRGSGSRRPSQLSGAVGGWSGLWKAWPLCSCRLERKQEARRQPLTCVSCSAAASVTSASQSAGLSGPRAGEQVNMGPAAGRARPRPPPGSRAMWQLWWQVDLGQRTTPHSKFNQQPPRGPPPLC